MVTILIGKSATGKDTIARELISKYDYEPIVSTTSRPMRDSEVDGREYNFVSRKEFEMLVNNDRLIEYRKYETLVDGNPDTWYYGLSKQTFDKNKNYVVILDIEGARSFVNYVGKENCWIFYIDTNDEIRKSRAKKRGSFDETEWNRRLEDDNRVFNDNDLYDINAYKIRNSEKISIENLTNFIISVISNEPKFYYLDFDGVIAQSCKSVCKILNERYDKNYNAEDVVSWNFSNCYGELNDNTIEDIFDDPLFFENLEFYDGAKDFILNNKNNVMIVTKGRDKNLELKKEWLNKNGLGNIEFIGIPLNVSKSVVDMSDGILIDDSVVNLKESNAMYKILFREFNNDAEWQKNWNGLVIRDWNFKWGD